VKELLQSMASGVMWRLLMLPFLIVPILIYLTVKNAPKPGPKDRAKKGEHDQEIAVTRVRGGLVQPESTAGGADNLSVTVRALAEDSVEGAPPTHRDAEPATACIPTAFFYCKTTATFMQMSCIAHCRITAKLLQNYCKSSDAGT
jgi:hypothetical protein